MIAQRSMRSHAVVVLPPLPGPNLRLLPRVEDLPIQQFVAELAVEALNVAFYHGAPGWMNSGPTPSGLNQSFTAVALNSGPSLDRM